MGRFEFLRFYLASIIAGGFIGAIAGLAKILFLLPPKPMVNWHYPRQP